MPSLSNRRIFLYIFPTVSGVLSGIALLYLFHWLAWVMLVPLFYSVFKETKYTFLKGFICGFIQGLILLWWIVAAAQKYSGTETNTGLVLVLINSIYFGLVIGIQVWLSVQTYRKIGDNKNAWWLNALAIGSIWIIIDWIRTRLTPGMPSMQYQYVCTQSTSIIPLQITAFTGAIGLTLLIVSINSLFTSVLLTKKYIRLLLPFTILSVLIIFGYLRLDINSGKQKTIKVALICDNIDAKQRWSAENGDSLATIFFELNRKAEKVKPQLIVWSESAITWDLAMDDNFITQCLKITWPSQAGHIIGIFSPSEKLKDKRFNSAYYIQPDGAITGRYDKMQLLTFLEKPIEGKKLPFFNSGARTDLMSGEKRSLLVTPYGNAGILICNETTPPNPFRETLELGADFFIVMANDAWFEGTQLIYHHFYFNRVRAVESGTDMVINSNRGISGIIDAKGRIQVSEISKSPKMIDGKINTRAHTSFYAKNGDWLMVLSIIYLAIILLTIIITKSKKS
jgi:apolipoprotein N-acyltransferase